MTNANENEPSSTAVAAAKNLADNTTKPGDGVVNGIKAVNGDTTTTAVEHGDDGLGQEVKESGVGREPSKEEEEGKAAVVVAHNDGIFNTMLR